MFPFGYPQLVMARIAAQNFLQRDLFAPRSVYDVVLDIAKQKADRLPPVR